MFRTVSSDWPPRPPEVRWDVLETAGSWLLAQVGGVFWAGLILAVAGVSTSSFADLPLTLTLASSFGLWLLYLFIPDVVSRRLGQGPARDFAFGRDVRAMAVGAVVGVAAQLAAVPLLYRLVGGWFQDDPGAAARDLVDRASRPSDIAFLVLAVVVVAPMAEERMYRGMMLPVITRHFGPTVGILLSSMIFAVAHRQLVVVPGLFLFACVLAWLTASTGRLGPAVVAHAAFNATTVVQLLVFGAG